MGRTNYANRMPLADEPVGSIGHFLELEVVALLARRLLLIERIPCPRVALGLLDHLFGEPLRPQPLTGLAAERIVRQRFHRQLDDSPFIALASEQPARQIILVPARRNDDLRRVGLEPRLEIVGVPSPDPRSRPVAIGILSTAHGIIDNSSVTATAGDRATDANRKIFAASKPGDQAPKTRAAPATIWRIRCR